MQIKSTDAKILSIPTEKGDAILLLPIGLELEEARDVSLNFSATIAKAFELYKEKRAKEENDDSDTDKSSV